MASRRLPACLLAIALSLAVPGGAVAQDPAAPPAPDPAALKAYEAKKREVPAQVAAKLSAVAEWALAQRMTRSALMLYKEVLDFHPEDAKARAILGYEKKGGAWVLNEAKARKLQDAEDMESRTEVRAAFDARLLVACKAAAQVMVGLGDAARKAGDEIGAREAWLSAWALHRQCPEANQRLGNMEVDGRWYTEACLRRRNFVREMKTLSEKVRSELPEAARRESIPGRGGPCVVLFTAPYCLCSEYDPKDARTIVGMLARTRTFAISILGLSADFDAEKGEIRIDVVKSTESFNWRRDHPSAPGALLIGDVTVEDAGRRASFLAARRLVRGLLGDPGIWLGEGLASFISDAAVQSGLEHLLRGRDGEADTYVMVSSDNPWELLADLVAAQKDTPMEEVVRPESRRLEYVQIAKAWSVTSYLIERNRDAAWGYFKAAGRSADASADPKLLKASFPEFEDWKALDAAWRKWINDCREK